MKNNKADTRNHMAERLLPLLMILTLLLGMMPVTAGAASPDLVITGYSATNTPLTTGENFTLSITYTNTSGALMEDLAVDFTDAATLVTVRNHGTTYTQPDLPIADADTLADVPLKYTGDGTDGRIPIVFSYTIGGIAGSTTAYIVLDTRVPSTPSTPTDTTQYVPKLTAFFSGEASTDGGQQNALTLTIKNIDASHSAKNVVITLPETYTYPFSGLNFNNVIPVSEIKPGESVDLPFLVSTDMYVTPDVHKLPLHLDFTNVWGDPFSQDVSLDVTVRNQYTPGLLLVETGTVNPAIAAGEDFELPVTILNQGNLPVNKVKINLENLSADGFMLASGSSRLSWDRIDGAGTQTVMLKLKAGTRLTEGSYAIHFRMEYEDARGEITEDMQQIWLPVKGAEAVDHSLEVIAITPSRTTLDPGQTVSVSITVKNSGTSEARQVKVGSQVDANVFFPTSQNLFILKSLAAGEEKKLTFTFQAQADAPRGSAPITLTVEAPSGTETPYTLSQAVSVFVAGETEVGDASKNVPKIIVYSYSAEPALVTAGDEFDLHLTFMNTHAGKAIRNIKANFTVNESSNETGSVFTPVGASNTFYVDAIGPKSTVDRTLRLFTIPDALSKTYNVTVTFGYEDEEGNPYTAEEVIGIPVYQPARFEISELNYMTDTTVGQMMPISFEMYNLGKNTLYNVKLRVEADQEGAATFEPKSQYYGNFETGHNEYAEVMINPMMPGGLTGKIIVTYESASGEAEELVKEFGLNVMDMPIYEDPGVVIGPDGNPLPIGPDGMPILEEPEQSFLQKMLAKPVIPVIVLVVLVVVVVLVIRRIRKKKDEKGLEF